MVTVLALDYPTSGFIRRLSISGLTIPAQQSFERFGAVRGCIKLRFPGRRQLVPGNMGLESCGDKLSPPRPDEPSVGPPGGKGAAVLRWENAAEWPSTLKELHLGSNPAH
jgi:hypothetical protein